MGWVVKTAPEPLYLWGRTGTHGAGGCVGPRAGLDVCGISHPNKMCTRFKNKVIDQHVMYTLP